MTDEISDAHWVAMGMVVAATLWIVWWFTGVVGHATQEAILVVSAYFTMYMLVVVVDELYRRYHPTE